jgi:inorganic pyrophosphatase
MSISTYLDTAPLFEIVKSSGGPPKDALPFTGYPRQHPFEKDKLIFVFDPLGDSPTILEFKLNDILYVEDLPSAVTETGEGMRLVKIYVKRGAYGVIHEPFEVQDPLRFIKVSKEMRDRLFRGMR